MRRKDFTPEQIEKVKDQCRRDLFFLGKEVIVPCRWPGGRTFTDFTQKPVCEFYVKKDPSCKTFRQFSDQYKGPKDRLMLLPRKGWKSTIKVIDDIQWLLCWPDISILTMTAERGLAKSFIDEFQQYFIVKRSERNTERKTKDFPLGVLEGGDPNIFQELFLEFCITEKESSVKGEFLSPARKIFSKEPTIGALSIQQSGSGWSCDVLNFDDVLSDDNTETGLQLEKLEKRIAMADKLRKKYGFRHLVGTRYDPNDAYGHLAESNGIMILYGEEETSTFKYMCKPCWWLKGRPYLQPDYQTWKPKPEDVDLFFPEDLTFNVLAKELREQPEVFFSQNLNDPIEASGVTYTEEFIRSCFVDHTQLPKRGTSFTAWDLAYGVYRGRDYSVGAHGLLDEQGRWWIFALTRGRFNHSELPFQIVNGINTFRPRGISIEDSQGAKWLSEAMERHARDWGVELNINWVSLGKGTEDAKILRMNQAYAPMAEKRLFFLNTIDHADDLVKEFKNVGNKRMRNDIPDAITRMIITYSGSAQTASLPTMAEDAKAWKEIEDRQFYNMIFQRGPYEPREPEPAPIVEEPEYALDPYTGLPS